MTVFHPTYPQSKELVHRIGFYIVTLKIFSAHKNTLGITPWGSGGTTANSVAGETILKISVRTDDNEKRAFLIKRIEEGYTSVNHTPVVRFNEEALPIGAAVHAYFAMRWLKDNS